MANLFSADQTTDKIYKHSGFTITILDSFATAASLCVDLDNKNDDIYESDDAGKHFQHTGFSATITDSFTATDPRGGDWMGANWLGLESAGEIDKFDGFSSSVLDTFAAIVGMGIAYDGTDILLADYTGDKIIKYSGFSATIKDSFATVNTWSLGVEWDGSNVISQDFIQQKIYLHSGFSTTISDSIATPGADSRGLTWYTVAPSGGDAEWPVFSFGGFRTGRFTG